MTDTPTRDGSNLGRFLLRNFVLYNPLFLFSAALILGAAWLVNPPNATGGRDLVLTGQLFGVIQLYELALLVAAGLLARKAAPYVLDAVELARWRERSFAEKLTGFLLYTNADARLDVRNDPGAASALLGRDVRFLALVLTPFLLDVTFTSSSLAVGVLTRVDVTGGVALACAVLVFAAFKAKVTSRLTGVRFDGLTWAVLLAAPAAVALLPLAGAALARAGYSQAVGALGGAVVAGFLLAVAGRAGDEGGRVVLRWMAPLLGAGVLVHASATTWTYTGALSHVFGLPLIALGIALPQLAWPARRDTVTPFVLPLVGVAVLAGGEAPILGIAAWKAGAVAAAAVHAYAFARTRALHFLAGGALAFHVTSGGTQAGVAVELCAALGLFGYALYRRAPRVLAAAPLLTAAGLLLRLEPFGMEAPDLLLACDLVGVGLLAWTHRTHGLGAGGARARFVGALLLYLPGFTAALYATPPAAATAGAWFGAAGALALLPLAGVTGLRGYAFPALFLPLEGATRVAPTTAVGWGVLGLGAAFAAVAGGVFVSLQRDRLLAWLERDDPEEAPAPRPASVLGETVPAAVVAVGLALVAALWFGPRVAKAEALRDAASFAAQARPPRAIGHRGR